MTKNTIAALEKQLFLLKEEVRLQKQEIDNLRKSEKRFKNIFEHANDLIHSLNPEGKFLYVNLLWQETLGYSSEEAKKMNIFDIVDPAYQSKCKSIFNCLMRGEKTDPTETVFIKKDGTKIFVEGRCNPKFEDGKAIELLGIFRDITLKKKNEDERERLIVELKKAVDEINALRGILPICTYCQKIRDDKGYWEQVDIYLHNHMLVDISHGICPDCAQKHYPEVYKEILNKKDNK